MQFIASSTRQGLRRAATFTPPQRTTFPISNLRSFSATPLSFASEAPRSPFEAPYSEASVPLFDRLQAHPEALQAIEALAKLAKEKTGVDLSNGDKPSMAMMLQLANDPELRMAAERLMSSLKAAGVHIDPKQAFEALKTMGDQSFEGAGGLEAAMSDEAFRANKKGDGDDEGKK